MPKLAKTSVFNNRDYCATPYSVGQIILFLVKKVKVMTFKIIVYIHLIINLPFIAITVAEAVRVGWASGGHAIFRQPYSRKLFLRSVNIPQELKKAKILQN